MTEIRTVNVHEIQFIAEQLIAERGKDYVYVDACGILAPEGICRNWMKDGDQYKPMCIVGAIIHRLNPDWLPMVDLGSAVNGALGQLSEVAKFTGNARQFLRMAQRMQDKGHTWWSSVAAASNHVEFLHS